MTATDTHTPEQEQRQRGVRRTVLILCVIILIVVALIVSKVLRPQAMSVDQLREHQAFLFDMPRRFSDFSLVDQTGAVVDRSIFDNKWSLVYFGFTHCPDVCPTALMDINRVLQSLPESLQQQTQVVLVTLDPARDTPAVLKEYLGAFNRDFIGLGGEFLTIRRFANEVNVAFARVTLENDYTIDHSTHLVLINPKGDFHAFFRPPFDNAHLGVTFDAITKRW